MTIDLKTVVGLAVQAGMARPLELGVNNLWSADYSDLQRFAALVLEHGRKPLCWLQQDKFGNFHIAEESWHGAFPVYKESSDAE